MSKKNILNALLVVWLTTSNLGTVYLRVHVDLPKYMQTWDFKGINSRIPNLWYLSFLKLMCSPGITPVLNSNIFFKNFSFHSLKGLKRWRVGWGVRYTFYPARSLPWTSPRVWKSLEQNKAINNNNILKSELL